MYAFLELYKSPISGSIYYLSHGNVLNGNVQMEMYKWKCTKWKRATRVQLRCIKSILHEPPFILKYVNDLIVATKRMLVSSILLLYCDIMNSSSTESNMDLVNLRDRDPKCTKKGPVHLWTTVVTTTHTENQGCAKVIALDPVIRTVLIGYKGHVEWTM